MNPTDDMIQQPLEKVNTPIGTSLRLWCAKCHAEGRKDAYNQVAFETGDGYAVDTICPRCGASSTPWHLMPPSSRTVLMAGQFPSQSIPNRLYEARVYEDGMMCCGCKAFEFTRRCWHLDALRDAISSAEKARRHDDEGRRSYYREIERCVDADGDIWDGQRWQRARKHEPIGGLRGWR